MDGNTTHFPDDLHENHSHTEEPTNPGFEECTTSTEFFLHMCLLPSVCVVAVFSFLERRRKVYSFEERFSCLTGRFGIVVPMDFTGTLRNRWSYGFAVGAASYHIFQLLCQLIKPFEAPSWLVGFVSLVAALEVGVAYLPFFICLSARHRGLGGALGLLYTLAWLIVAVKDVLCDHRSCDMSSIFTRISCYVWLLELPYLLCLVFLFGRFGFMLVKDIRLRLQKNWKQVEDHEVLKSHQYKYVQALLRQPSERLLQKTWFLRSVYEWDPYFKFPNRMIATAIVSFIGLYMFIFIEQVFASLGFDLLQAVPWQFLNKHLNYLWNTWHVTTAFATLASVANIGHVLVCYRKHMKRLWAGKKSFLPEKYHTPESATSVTALARYPGYQIAFTIWGYLIVHLALWVFGLVFVFLVVDPIQMDFLNWLNNVMIFLGNFFIVLALLGLQILLVRIFFLQDRISPEDEQKPLALNNRKAFHNFNYFFFFYNVILGLMSCFLRLFGSAFVSLLLVSRINRTIMPKGFELLDRGYRTYIAMIMADHYHSNPVMVCFCHLLLKHTVENQAALSVYTRLNSTPGPVHVRGRVRWLLAYTLLKNPKLILLRRRGTPSSGNRDDLAVAWVTLQTQRAETPDTAASTDPRLSV